MTAKEVPDPQAQFGTADIGALAHLYRGELYRSTMWRTRLDTTTNWAVVTSGIALSVAFSDEDASVLPIVLVSFLVAVFLILEGRRYRYYDVCRTRLRIMETHFYRPILHRQPLAGGDLWSEVLGQDFQRAHFHISIIEAIGRRLRRNYSWIFGVQVISFWGKALIHPDPLESFNQLWIRTAVGPIPGYVVLLVGAVFYAGLVLLGVLTLRGQRAVGRTYPYSRNEDRAREFVASIERQEE